MYFHDSTVVGNFFHLLVNGSDGRYEDLDSLYLESRNMGDDWNETTYLAIAIGTISPLYLV